MLPLLRTLQDHDAGHLRVIAELWGIDLPPGPAKETAEALARVMLDRDSIADLVDGLSPQARQALGFLLEHEGRYPIADMERNFGIIRQMGPGRRDREKPWRSPVSSLEALWYRGLIARAFADTPSGPQEFLFVPSDLYELLPQPSVSPGAPPGRPSAPPLWSRSSSLTAADDATTLLAALRRRSAKTIPLPPDRERTITRFLGQPSSTNLLVTLLHERGLLSGPPYQPQTHALPAFLDLSRLGAVQFLLRAWESSAAWNDLEHVPTLAVASDRWPNDPTLARRAILSFLRRLPAATWWDLEAFLVSIRETQPGFQRPAGDFDSWYLRDTVTGDFLRGFEHWDVVEGALLRSVILQPLYWLGVLDLGGPTEDEPPTAFRLSEHAPALLGLVTTDVAATEPSIDSVVFHDGGIRVPRLAARALRYQIARFSAWLTLDDEGWQFRLTPTSLQGARAQGLQLSHVRRVLEAASGRSLPPSLLRALDRWNRQGTEASLERSLVLRLASRRVLQELRQNKSTARYLGEDLGPSCVRVREQDWRKLCLAAGRFGLFIDPPAGEELLP